MSCLKIYRSGTPPNIFIICFKSKRSDVCQKLDGILSSSTALEIGGQLAKKRAGLIWLTSWYISLLRLKILSSSFLVGSMRVIYNMASMANLRFSSIDYSNLLSMVKIACCMLIWPMLYLQATNLLSSGISSYFRISIPNC